MKSVPAGPRSDANADCTRSDTPNPAHPKQICVETVRASESGHHGPSVRDAGVSSTSARPPGASVIEPRRLDSIRRRRRCNSLPEARSRDSSSEAEAEDRRSSTDRARRPMPRQSVAAARRRSEVAELQAHDFIDDWKLRRPPVVAHQLKCARRDVRLEVVRPCSNLRGSCSSVVAIVRWWTAMLQAR